MRDAWSGLLVTAVTLGWFLIGGWALLGAVVVGYDTPAGNELPGVKAFTWLASFSVVAGVAAWLRFRFVYQTFLTGTRTTGVLVSASVRSGSAKLRFEFVHEGKTHRAVNYVAGGPFPKSGETVNIVYDPARPSRAYVWDAYVPKRPAA